LERSFGYEAVMDSAVVTVVQCVRKFVLLYGSVMEVRELFE
jgi:hypothetical protein